MQVFHHRATGDGKVTSTKAYEPSKKLTHFITTVMNYLPICTILHHSVQFHAIFYYFLLFWSILYNFVRFSAILYHSLPFSTILYHSLPFSTNLYHSLPFSTFPYHSLPCYSCHCVAQYLAEDNLKAVFNFKLGLCA
jgi:hypothetical protein